MFGDFYKSKRVLVTGHTGFKGSWLTHWLLELGAEVSGYSLSELPSEPSLFQLLGLADRIRDFRGDIRDLDQYRQVYFEVQPDVVFHLAAQSIVRESHREPYRTFTVNAGGTLTVLEAVRECPTPEVLLIVTSDKCYQNGLGEIAFDESSPLGGDDPYSASKACANLIFNSYSTSILNRARTAVVSARAGNVLGGGDWAADRIVPDCIRAWTKGEEITIRNPLATRPWQHVLDCLSGYLWLAARAAADKSLAGESFNFGPSGSSLPVVDLVNRLAVAGPWKGRWQIATDDRDAKEAPFLQLDCSKAKRLLNWQTTLSVQEAFEFTAEWYSIWSIDPASAIQQCAKQIGEFHSLAVSRGLPWA